MKETFKTIDPKFWHMKPDELLAALEKELGKPLEIEKSTHNYLPKESYEYVLTVRG